MAGTEVAAADADVDDARDGPAGVALPLARPNAPGEVAHLVQDSVHARNDVDTVDDDVFGQRGPQRDVKHRPVLGHVDLVAPEHGIDALGQTRPMGQRDQQRQGFRGDAILGEVDAEIFGFDRESVGPLWIGREEIAQVEVFDRAVVGVQRLPLVGLGESRR